MMKYLILLTLFIAEFNSTLHSQTKVIKSENEWKSILTSTEYFVLREKGTERANSGVYNKFDEIGIYNCAGCSTPLFQSKDKYNSYSGWPSFDRFIGTNVTKVADNSHGMKRVEVVCTTCDGHLGHVFEDGPKTTGFRYCINSVSLNFEPKK